MTVLQVPNWSRPFHIHRAMQYHHKVSSNILFHKYMLDFYCTYRCCVHFKVSIHKVTHFVTYVHGKCCWKAIRIWNKIHCSAIACNISPLFASYLPTIRYFTVKLSSSFCLSYILTLLSILFCINLISFIQFNPYFFP